MQDTLQPTRRGRQILCLMVQGITKDADIATRLGISPRTVHDHIDGNLHSGLRGLRGICFELTGRKLSKTEILLEALSQRWVTLEQE